MEPEIEIDGKTYRMNVGRSDIGTLFLEMRQVLTYTLGGAHFAFIRRKTSGSLWWKTSETLREAIARTKAELVDEIEQHNRKWDRRYDLQVEGAKILEEIS